MDLKEGRNPSLWLLPLVAGLAPATAAAAALLLSIAHELVPSCNPLLDGCVSISRAARHGLANHVFRAIVLPAAVLQALTWCICAMWLRAGGTTRPLRALPCLGIAAGVFLVIYGTFLGTDGEAYRWMRRYGVTFYFGLTYLCMVIASGALWRLARSPGPALPGRLDRWLVGLCAATLATGLLQAFATRLLTDEGLKDRLENLLEWYVGLAFTLFFVGLAWMWFRLRLSLRLVTDTA